MTKLQLNAEGVKKLKIGFSKTGLTIDSKKFNPLNLSVNGHGFESNLDDIDVNPFEILGKLAEARNSDMTKQEKVNVIKNVVK